MRLGKRVEQLEVSAYQPGQSRHITYLINAGAQLVGWIAIPEYIFCDKSVLKGAVVDATYVSMYRAVHIVALFAQLRRGARTERC